MEYNYSEHQRWVKDNGDKTHRMNYSLSGESIVVDAGGYHGDWSQEILQRYGSKIFIIEPLEEYYKEISNKFKSDSRVSVYNFGLAARNEEVLICLDNDSSSIHKSGNGYQKINVKSIDYFLDKTGITKIDLFKINIEGAEYDLLESILDKSIQYKIENLQIQFHVFIPDCAERRRKIQEALSKTHECTYNYEFIWENWRLKK